MVRLFPAIVVAVLGTAGAADIPERTTEDPVCRPACPALPEYVDLPVGVEGFCAREFPVLNFCCAADCRTGAEFDIITTYDRLHQRHIGGEGSDAGRH